MAQVLECLLENAVKFSPEGGAGRAHRHRARRRAPRHRARPRRVAADAGRRGNFRQDLLDDDTAIQRMGTLQRHLARAAALPRDRAPPRRQASGHRTAAAAVRRSPSSCLSPKAGRRCSTPPNSAGGTRALRVLLVMQNDVLAEAAARALRLDDIDGRVCSHFQEVLSMSRDWIPDVLVVSSNCLWQLTEGIAARLRKAGVANIMMFSPYEGMVDMSAPTHCGPLLARFGDVVGARRRRAARRGRRRLRRRGRVRALAGRLQDRARQQRRRRARHDRGADARRAGARPRAAAPRRLRRARSARGEEASPCRPSC